MKKRIVLFTSVALIGFLSLSSYTYGPATQATLDLTGDTGGSTNCNTGGGCHANNSTTTQDTIYVIDKSTGLAVTQYDPGITYTVNLRGTNTNTALTHFGFQLAAVLYSGSQAGTFSVLKKYLPGCRYTVRRQAENRSVLVLYWYWCL